MDQLIQFMVSQTGRAVRIIAGIVLILLGIASTGALQIILIILGIVAVAAGAVNFCLLAPLVGKPLMAKDMNIPEDEV